MRVMRLARSDGREVARRVEIADDVFSVTRGLLGRASLARGEGMVLVGCWNIHMFFMRFAIDVIFVDGGMEVLKVIPGLRPWRVAACLGALSTIELGEGTLQEAEVRPGDRLELVEEDKSER